MQDSRHPGNQEELGAGDLLAWLSAIHVAQLDAGELFDDAAWAFFLEWYCDLG